MIYIEPRNYQTMMTMPLLMTIFEHQTILDAAFLEVANRHPEPDDRLDAAFDEAAEFVAEFKTINKYWTIKNTDFDKVLDEHSDIIHFIVGYMIAVGKTPKNLYYRLGHYYDNLIEDYNDMMDHGHNYAEYWQKVRFFLRIIRRSDSPMEQLAAATIVLGMCGFTEEDILRQYEIKRDENYRRIAKTAKGENDR